MFDNNEIKESSVIQAAERVEGCRLIEMKKNEDNSITFSFTQPSTGSILNHREFMPKKRPTDTDEKFKSNVQLSMSRIAHIARSYMTEERFKAIKVEDGGNLSKFEQNWNEYLKLTFMAITEQNYTTPEFQAIIQDAEVKDHKDLPVALKVTLRENTKDGKWYAGLPAVPSFISSPIHTKVFTTNPQYDVYAKPVAVADADIGPGEQQQANSPTNIAPSADPSGF